MNIPECKVCYERELSSTDPLICPCQCKGSMAYIHQSCLDRMIEYQGTTCPVCKSSYINNKPLSLCMLWLHLSSGIKSWITSTSLGLPLIFIVIDTIKHRQYVSVESFVSFFIFGPLGIHLAFISIHETLKIIWICLCISIYSLCQWINMITPHSCDPIINEIQRINQKVLHRFLARFETL